MVIFSTMDAYALYQQVHFLGLVAFGKRYGRYLYIQAIGLPACGALEVNMVVVMLGPRAVGAAKCVLEAAFVVKHFMYQAPGQKGFECSVNRDPVQGIVNAALNVAVRQRVVFFEKKV